MPRLVIPSFSIENICTVANLTAARDSFKTLFVARSLIFKRDEEDEQKDRKCSGGYIEDLFVKSDEVAVKNLGL